MTLNELLHLKKVWIFTEYYEIESTLGDIISDELLLQTYVCAVYPNGLNFHRTLQADLLSCLIKSSLQHSGNRLCPGRAKEIVRCTNVQDSVAFTNPLQCLKIRRRDRSSCIRQLHYPNPSIPGIGDSYLISIDGETKRIVKPRSFVVSINVADCLTWVLGCCPYDNRTTHATDERRLRQAID